MINQAKAGIANEEMWHIPKRHKKTVLIAALCMFFLVGSVQGYRALRGDPVVEQMRALQAQLENPDLSREDRNKIRDQMRELGKDLTEDQKKVLEKDGEERSMARERKEMEKYESFFKLSKEEQIQKLDEEIAREVKMQEEAKKRREARAAQQGGEGQNGAGGGPGGQGGGRGRRGGGGQGGGDGGGANAGGPAGEAGAGGGRGPGGFGGGPGQRTKKTEEEKELDRKKRIDNTTAEQRAMKTEYQRELDARRVALGYPSIKDRPRGGRGGPGGGMAGGGMGGRGGFR